MGVEATHPGGGKNRQARVRHKQERKSHATCKAGGMKVGGWVRQKSRLRASKNGGRERTRAYEWYLKLVLCRGYHFDSGWNRNSDNVTYSILIGTTGFPPRRSDGCRSPVHDQLVGHRRGLSPAGGELAGTPNPSTATPTPTLHTPRVADPRSKRSSVRAGG
jgi:hypothetical protein